MNKFIESVVKHGAIISAAHKICVTVERVFSLGDHPGASHEMK